MVAAHGSLVVIAVVGRSGGACQRNVRSPFGGVCVGMVADGLPPRCAQALAGGVGGSNGSSRLRDADFPDVAGHTGNHALGFRRLTVGRVWLRLSLPVWPRRLPPQPRISLFLR